MQDYIDRQVAEGRFESHDAVIANAVAQVMADIWRWDEDEELLAAIADADRGEDVVVTDFRDYLDGLSRRARESADDEVRDDVKY